MKSSIKFLFEQIFTPRSSAKKRVHDYTKAKQQTTRNGSHGISRAIAILIDDIHILVYILSYVSCHFYSPLFAVVPLW